MASWITHLRVADSLLENIGTLSITHFIVGNIAPDSGEPVNGDWNVFSPSKEISHWKLSGVPRSERAEYFRESYLTDRETPERTAFYLGYYSHLLTDYIWARDVYLPQLVKYADEFAKDPGFMRLIKREMSDLDRLYLRDNPNFRAYQRLAGVKSFPNTYLNYFSNTAIENRIKGIVDYFSEKCELPIEFQYITPTDIDRFVGVATAEIRQKIPAALQPILL